MIGEPFSLGVPKLRRREDDRVAVATSKNEQSAVRHVLRPPSPKSTHHRSPRELPARDEHHQGRERDDEGGQEPLLPRRRHGAGLLCAAQATASTKFCTRQRGESVLTSKATRLMPRCIVSTRSGAADARDLEPSPGDG